MQTPTHQALELATRAGLSGVEIARICGVHHTTVSRWRRSDRNAPKLDLIAPLLIELDMLVGVQSDNGQE